MKFDIPKNHHNKNNTTQKCMRIADCWFYILNCSLNNKLIQMKENIKCYANIRNRKLFWNMKFKIKSQNTRSCSFVELNAEYKKSKSYELEKVLDLEIMLGIYYLLHQISEIKLWKIRGRVKALQLNCTRFSV